MENIRVDSVYRINIRGQEFILTRSELATLRDTINSIVGKPATGNSDELVITSPLPENIPDNISEFGKAMIAICLRYHKGKDKRANSATIAEEMARDFPEVLNYYGSLGKISSATIYTAKNKTRIGLVDKKHLKMEKNDDEQREYWVD